MTEGPTKVIQFPNVRTEDEDCAAKHTELSMQSAIRGRAQNLLAAAPQAFDRMLDELNEAVKRYKLSKSLEQKK